MVMTAASLWGTLGLFGKALLPTGLTPIELASVRSAIGFLTLGLWLLIRRRGVEVRWRDVPFFAVYGALSVALFQYLYFGAIARTAISVAAALLYTAPAFVVILARIFLKEHLSGLHLAALAMVLAGVLLVTGALQAVAADAAPITAAAIAFGLGSGFTYGLYTLFGKTALRRYDAISTVFFAFGFGALFLGIAAPPWRPIITQPSAIPLMVAMGLFPTLVAYLLYIGGLRHLTAGSASILSTVEPVVIAPSPEFAEQYAG